MVCQRETGVLPGSEIFFHTVGVSTQRLFYYINACGHYYCEFGYRVRRKELNNLLLLLIEKGEMRVEYRGQKYVAEPGDIVLMDCTDPQYYDTPHYVEFYWMHLAGVNSFELCDYLTSARKGIVHRAEHNENAATLVRHLVSQFVHHQPISDADQSRALHSIYCYLMPDAHSLFATQRITPVQQAVTFIQSHLSENLNLKRLAAEVHLSPSHLIRLFQSELHRSPHEYIVLMRMDRAKYLLKTTSLPIKAIAAEVGYRIESSFTSAFTEKIGLSPRQFRNLPLG